MFNLKQWVIPSKVQCTKLLRDSMDVTHELSKLIKYSPKRNVIFDQLKECISPNTPGFQVLCPMRLTVHAKSVWRVLKTTMLFYWNCGQQYLMVLLILMCMPGCVVLNHADNLSVTLQQSTISASKGQHVAKLSLSTLEKLRNEESFQMFWAATLRQQQSFDIGEPRLPCKRKCTQRYEEGEIQAFRHDSPVSFYKQIYICTLKLLTVVCPLSDRGLTSLVSICTNS